MPEKISMADDIYNCFEEGTVELWEPYSATGYEEVDDEYIGNRRDKAMESKNHTRDYDKTIMLVSQYPYNQFVEFINRPTHYAKITKDGDPFFNDYNLSDLITFEITEEGLYLCRAKRRGNWEAEFISFSSYFYSSSDLLAFFRKNNLEFEGLKTYIHYAPKLVDPNFDFDKSGFDEIEIKVSQEKIAHIFQHVGTMHGRDLYEILKQSPEEISKFFDISSTKNI